MKSLNDDNNGNTNNNWLGFSLSPHMKMEVNTEPYHHFHHQTHPPPTPVSNAVPTSFYLSSSNLNPTGICYGEGENSAFHSPLCVMPLKSDGSLCIMEALSRSQAEGLLRFCFCLLGLFLFFRK